MEFVACRHAADEGRAAEVRRCTSPKLTGLRVVSPDMCGGCALRDHVDDTAPAIETPHWLDCAYLGDELPHLRAGGENGNGKANGAVHYACRHPQHTETTAAKCSGCCDYLFPRLSPQTSPEVVAQFAKLPPLPQPREWWTWENVILGQRLAVQDFIARLPPRPSSMAGRGIVVVGGGKYLVSAYVTIRVLRHVGCTLPIELWHLAGEVDDPMREILDRLGATCVDADAVAVQHPFRFLSGHFWKGWQLKSYALAHTSFREVLLLDADCYPVRDPSFLFEHPAYREWGAILWPDQQGSMGLFPQQAWRVFGARSQGDLPTESGQMLVNRDLCWREVNLALHYNSQADFVYRWLYGDKDTFPLAWRRLGRNYARLWPESWLDEIALRQFDDAGETLFIHRVHDKFRLPGVVFQSSPQPEVVNRFRPQYPLEAFCFSALDELRRQWRPQSQSESHSSIM